MDLSTLDDQALADHLRAVHDHLREHTRLHFRLHVSDMGPLGMLMVHLEDWGLHRDDTFRALVSASPETRAPADKLRAVAAAVRDAGVDPASLSTLDEVRDASPDAAARLEEYLADHGWRLTTGYDIEDRCLAELPDVLLASIKSASAPGVAEGAHADALEALRAQVPEEHRAVFDEAVDDARLSYGLRDENGPLTYEWPAGLLRRALARSPGVASRPQGGSRPPVTCSSCRWTRWWRC